MYQARIQRVLDAMAVQGLSQFLISDPNSIWYLTGYDVTPMERMLILYLRKGQVPTLFVNRLFPVPEGPWETVWYEDTDDCVSILADHVDTHAPMGIDKEWPARFLLPFMARCPQCALASACVDDARARKDNTEQALMREASQINDIVMEKAAEQLQIDVTEQAVADFILNEYAAAGCEGPSFPPIVSFGPHAADPHHEPDSTPLKPGDCIVLDIGCRKNRYCSDMTRTYFCGQPSEKHAAIHDLVRTANELAEQAIRPGVPLRELDRIARSHIAAAGYGEFFTHRLGHFIGQTDHEQGDVSAVTPLVAEPGMIFSIEPGVYLPGEFGVRVEDLVLVTEDGCELLNRVDKHWCRTGKRIQA